MTTMITTRGRYIPKIIIRVLGRIIDYHSRSTQPQDTRHDHDRALLSVITRLPADYFTKLKLSRDYN